MTADDRRARALDLMEAFALETGLTGEEQPRRYLWTDAFAVCEFLGLHGLTGQVGYRKRALELVDQVHRILGRHRADDEREGWISGLPDGQGGSRPTAGGLRIGKARPERPSGEPLVPAEEWDRDGQYYHYLTKWMHALNRVWQATGSVRYYRWAVELALVAHEAFRRGADPEDGLYWKMSIDLSRPLVPSTGAQDPLDGLLTLCSLRASAPERSDASGSGTEEEEEEDAVSPAGPRKLRELDEAIDDLERMCAGGSWVTDDPLGAGGLLVDAYRAVELRARGALPREGLAIGVLEDAARSLETVAESKLLEAPVSDRLAFRELGLSVGLAAVHRLLSRLGDERRRGEGEGAVPADAGPALDPSLVPETLAERLAEHLTLREELEDFWSDPDHQATPGWQRHRDISTVMLATSLAPGGFLGH